MPLLPSQNIHRYITSAMWPQGLETAYITNIKTVWPLQPILPGPCRKNPVATPDMSTLSVSKIEEHCYLHQLRSRKPFSLCMACGALEKAQTDSCVLRSQGSNKASLTPKMQRH